MLSAARPPVLPEVKVHRAGYLTSHISHGGSGKSVKSVKYMRNYFVMTA